MRFTLFCMIAAALPTMMVMIASTESAVTHD
jgi:hypothetical protein